MNRKAARHWFIAGRVQGVWFRFFVQDKAAELGLAGWVRNLADGRVEVYAVGSPARLDQLAGALHMGPRMADVRSVEARNEEPENLTSFAIR